MSAWIVSKAHIDALVQDLIVRKVIELDTASIVGTSLWAENHASVNFRYRENTETPEYVFSGIEAPLLPEAMKLLWACFDYQTCEHPSYEQSAAFAMVDAAGQRYVDVPRDSSGKWWGISELVEATRP